MSDQPNNKLERFVERIENLMALQRETAKDIADTFKEAEAAGYHKAALRQVIREKREDAEKRTEREQNAEIYRHQLGLF